MLSTETSDTARVALRDDTSVVEVALRGAEVDGARALPDQLTDAPEAGMSLPIGPFTTGGGSDSGGYERVEQVLVEGEALSGCCPALSRPAGDLEVVSTEDAPLVVSTRSEEQLLEGFVRRGQRSSAGAAATGQRPPPPPSSSEGQASSTATPWMASPARAPTTVPLMRMNCRSRPTAASMRADASRGSQPATVRRMSATTVSP